MVRKYILDNGITVLLEPMKDVVSVSVGLWLDIGSRHEKTNQQGYAHFTEHMLFKGTKRYSARDIAQNIDRVGGQHNAATNREYTCYYINVIADYLELSIDLLSDMYYNSLFEIDEIKKERNVILEEIKMYEDSPDELIHDVLVESMLGDHPLGHSILGTTENIQNVSREGLMGFLDEHYTDDNSFFVIAGKFNEKEAMKLIKKYFPRNNIQRKKELPIFSTQKALITRKHISRELEQVHFCIGMDGIEKKDEDRWALYSLSTILGGNMSSRLFQKVRENEGLCYSVYSFHSSYIDKGIFGIYCGTAPDNFERTVELIMNECMDLLENGISEEELMDARTFMKGNLALIFESTEVRMGQLARNEMSYSRYYSYDDIVEMINSITLDDFNRVCQRIFGERKHTLVSIGRLNEESV